MFTDNHRRYLKNLLRHVEHEVQEGLAPLHGEDHDALFPRYRNFPAPERIEALEAHQVRLRAAMRRFMDAHHIPYAEPAQIDAAWGFQTRLMLVRNAVYELRPRHVRGYGPLDVQAEQDCRAMAAELGMLMDSMAGELRQKPLRLAEGRTDNALLATLVDLVERHRLFEYRSRLEALLAREHGDRLEVALLGRVSSGKSSLINALLERPLLPVGAVPVTTVVTRVRHGDNVDIRAVDVDGHVQPVEIGALREYVDESGNPGNRKRLREVNIRVPAALLEHGLVFADTPGLGSLHAHASAHALDYLPRCDLGILAIDAASTLQPQDLDLLRALHDGNAHWLVVLSKADTVSAEALEQQRQYMETAIAEAMHTTVTVTPLSTQPGHRDRFDAWMDTVLKPALASTIEDAETRYRHRCIELAGRVRASLQQALDEQSGDTKSDATPDARGDILAGLEETHHRLHHLVRSLAERGADVVTEEAVTQTPRATTLTTEDLDDRAAKLADAVVRDVLSELRGITRRIDTEAAGNELRGIPAFTVALPELALPTGSLPRLLRQPLLRRRLRVRAEPSLQHAFDTYASELNRWLDQVVHRLREQTSATSGADTTAADTDPATLRTDLQRLAHLIDPPSGASDAVR